MASAFTDPAGSRAASGDAAGLLVQARQLAQTHNTCVFDELQALAPAEDVAAWCLRAGAEAVTEPARVQQWHTQRGGLAGASRWQLATLADKRQVLLMADPWNASALAEATAALRRYVEPMAASGAVLTALGDTESPAVAVPVTGAGTSGTTSTGVVAFVDGAIARAYSEGASDLHFECDRAGVNAKLRLDGVMSFATRLEGRQNADEVISRIKVMAQLDITERRLPQDGRFRHAVAAGEIDFRVSIMPSVHGEDAVLRLLDKSHLQARGQQVSLAGLGFGEPDAARIRRLAHLPNGMLLVTGPTGSGKTTTLYATLTEISTGQEKIITIEDPVEYELPGVLQIPVNERKGLTFARGLRSVLRHDPDRILVGEIRDADTAAIAVQSALTGHLVYTTVHANSLFDVVGRFRHFGIDMFGFVWSLNGVVVQRLMRRLCPHCVGERPPSADEAQWLQAQGRVLARLPRAAGCDACHQTGYRGRFVVAEIHTIGDGFRDMLMRNEDVSEIKRVAFSAGVAPLVQIAIDQVQAGKTSLEEVFRVVGQV